MSIAIWNEIAALKERVTIIERSLGIQSTPDPRLVALEDRMSKIEMRKKPGPKRA